MFFRMLGNHRESLNNNLIVTAIVIIVARVERCARFGVYLAGIETQIVDLRIFLNFLLLVVCQTVSVVLKRFCK